MQIISDRRLLFQKITYTSELDANSKATGRRVAEVQASIIVNADSRPQVVPEWVREDDLFKQHVDDGNIIEVTARKTPVVKRVDPSLKNVDSTQTPVAEIAESAKSTPVVPPDSGWGAK